MHQLNMCKTMVQSLAHTFVGCYTGCVPLFKILSVSAEYVRDNGTQAQSLADTFAGWYNWHFGSVQLFKTFSASAEYVQDNGKEFKAFLCEHICHNWLIQKSKSCVRSF